MAIVKEGRVPYHEHDGDDINQALAAALGERKVRLTDRRLLILYGGLVLAFVLFGWYYQHNEASRHQFQHSVVTNCRTGRDNTIAFNHFVDKLIQSYRTSPVLTPAQRRDRMAFFAEVKQQVPVCPPD